MSVSDPSTWPQYAKIDPEFEATLKVMPALPGMGDFPDIPTARQFINQMMAQMAAASPPVDYTGVKKSDIQIPTSDGASIRAILYQPESKPAAGGPLVVLYHGGGFCLGTPEMEELFALELVKKHGAVAISVDYRMAPEHPFPGPITDSWDALKWAAKNASSVGADPSKGFIIGGTSAGAMITATISHMARDEKLSPPLTGVWLNVPMVIAQSVMPEKYRAIHTSYDQNKDAPVLDITAINFFMKYYNPDDKDPRHSSLLWPSGHKDLPPHLIQACGLDPLRDDSLIYYRELQEQGVKSEIVVYPGVPHGFDGLFAQIGQAQKFLKDRSAWITSLLGK